MLLAMALYMFLVSNHFKTEKRLFNFFLIVFVSAAVVFIYQAVHLLLGFDLLPLAYFKPKAANLVGKWNDFSIFFGLIGVLSLVFFRTFKSSAMVKTILIAALATTVIVLVFTNFLLNWIVLGSIALIVLVYSLFKKDIKNKIKTIKVPLLFIVLALFFILFRGISGDISTSVGLGTSEVRPAFSSTMSIAKGVIKEGPVRAALGSGPNTFSILWARMKPLSVNNTIFWNTNFPSGLGHAPTLLATTGILGGLSLLFFAIMFLKQGLYVFKSGRADGDFLTAVGWASFLGAAYLWIMIVFYTPGIVIMSLAFALTGIMISTLSLLRNSKERELSFAGKKMGFIFSGVILVMIIGAAALFYMQASKFLALGYYGKGVKAFNINGDIGVAENNLKKAVFLDGNQDEYRRSLAELGLVKINSGVYKPGESEEETIKFGEALNYSIEVAKMATKVDSLSAENWMQLGGVYELAAKYGIENAEEMAMVSYQEAAKVSPLNPNPFYLAARLKFLLGKNSEAKEYLDYALSLKPDFASALYLAAQIQIKEGNTKEAIMKMIQAAVAAPGDIGLHFQLGVLAYQNKDMETARLAFEKVILLNPFYANAKYFLGLIYDGQGLNEQALEQFKGILETNPGNKEVEKIIQNILSGKGALSGVATLQGVNPPISDKTDDKLKEPNEIEDKKSE